MLEKQEPATLLGIDLFMRTFYNSCGHLQQSLI